MRVRYSGPHTAAVLPDGTVAYRGKHTEVDDDLGDALVRRPDFRRAPDPPRKPDPDPDPDDVGDAGEED